MAARSYLSFVMCEKGEIVSSNVDCLLTNLFIVNGKDLLATSTENKIQLRKIHDIKTDRENKWD